MNEVYLIDLEGDGDRIIALVTKEVFDWVMREDTPGRENNETGWIDTATPQIVKDSYPETSEQDFLITSGSYNNDRAIIAVSGENLHTFDSIKDLTEHIKKYDLTIGDEFQGLIY